MVTRQSRKRLTLTSAGIRQRARKIKLVLTDVDGVLTDGGIYYNEAGEELYRFSRRDGMGVDLLRNAGIEAGLVTSEQSEIIRRRAEKLKLQYVFLGIRDKRGHLTEILKAAGLTINQLAYIGDDVNDLEIIRHIGQFGLTASPADAVAVVAKEVHYRCAARGGHGAFREFVEWILQHNR